MSKKNNSVRVRDGKARVFVQDTAASTRRWAEMRGVTPHMSVLDEALDTTATASHKPHVDHTHIAVPPMTEEARKKLADQLNTMFPRVSAPRGGISFSDVVRDAVSVTTTAPSVHASGSAGSPGPTGSGSTIWSAGGHSSMGPVRASSSSWGWPDAEPAPPERSVADRIEFEYSDDDGCWRLNIHLTNGDNHVIDVDDLLVLHRFIEQMDDQMVEDEPYDH